MREERFHVRIRRVHNQVFRTIAARDIGVEIEGLSVRILECKNFKAGGAAGMGLSGRHSIGLM
jgi:hypothetical protein